MDDSETKMKKNVKFVAEQGDHKHDDHKNASLFELTREDVVAAFEFFATAPDTSEKKGEISDVLTTGLLKNRLSAFFPNLTSKEYRFLLEASGVSHGTSSMGQPSQESSDFTVETLWELIDTYQQQFYKPARGAPSTSSAPSTPKSVAHNLAVTSTLEAVSRFDPVKEAFHVYDPHGSGSVDVQMLRSIMSRIEIGELSDEELAILVRTADFDQDGRINLDDFRRLVCMKGRLMNDAGENNTSES